ncbi:hypothetical protein ACVLHI_004666, partial [Paenibacillus sp. PvR053]
MRKRSRKTMKNCPLKTEQRVSALNRESIDSRQHCNELFNQL